MTLSCKIGSNSLTTSKPYQWTQLGNNSSRESILPSCVKKTWRACWARVRNFILNWLTTWPCWSKILQILKWQGNIKWQTSVKNWVFSHQALMMDLLQGNQCNQVWPNHHHQLLSHQNHHKEETPVDQHSIMKFSNQDNSSIELTFKSQSVKGILD